MRTQRSREGGCHQKDMMFLYFFYDLNKIVFLSVRKRRGRATIQSEEAEGTVRLRGGPGNLRR